MWVLRLSIFDGVYSKTQILLGTLRTKNQPHKETLPNRRRHGKIAWKRSWNSRITSEAVSTSREWRSQMTPKPATTSGWRRHLLSSSCWPRDHLHVPKAETFPIPLKNIDVTRSTHTNLHVMQEKRTINDYWNVDGDRTMSDSWTGFTKFTW